MTAEARPYSETIWDEVETWSRDRIESFQFEQLSQQLASVAKRSAHYARVFRDAGFEPGDLRSLDDLRRLPLTRKQDYVAGLDQQPPFGSLAATARPKHQKSSTSSSGWWSDALVFVSTTTSRTRDASTSLTKKKSRACEPCGHWSWS